MDAVKDHAGEYERDVTTGHKDGASQLGTTTPEGVTNTGFILSASSLGVQQQPQPLGSSLEKAKNADNASLVGKAKKPHLSKCQIVIFVMGSLMVIFSIAMLAGGFQAMFDAILQMEMEVEEGSMSYDIWKKTPFPLIMNLYLFNITNHEDFLEGAKPDLQEVGPYVWREYHEKQGLEFHENHTVTYLQQRWWIWDEERSGNNSLEDRVFTLNPVPVSAAWSVRKNIFARPYLNAMFNETGEQAVVETSVEELIFTGFQDNVLDWVQENLIAENGTLHPILPILDLPPGLVSYDKFGWFYSRNNSLYYDGVFNMMTGTDDIGKVGQIDWWNYTRETNFFDYPCNEVLGSAGEYFESGLERENITFYSSDLCMSIVMYYKEDVEKGGVNGYRFWGTNETFTNGRAAPDDECFCVKGTCAPSGLVNSESCRMGSPAFVSFPHYFYADPFLLDQVNGLSPDGDKHAFVMDIMPEAGIPLSVRARMQINMKVTPYPGKGLYHRIDILANVPDIYLPMLWFEELADVPDDMCRQLKALQVIMDTPVMTIVFSITLVIGVAMMATVIIRALMIKYREKK